MKCHIPAMSLLAVSVAAAIAPISLAAGPENAPGQERQKRRLPPSMLERDNHAIPPDIVTEDDLAWFEKARKPISDTWLGVQLAPVPAALVAHLEADTNAVMVRNIFRDSPADQAGLERYDLIVAADAKPLEAGVKGFSKYVGEKKPGDKIELTILRKGGKSTHTVELTRRPADWGKLELKYQDDPDVAHQREFSLRGKILQPGPQGWELHDLGELPEDFIQWHAGQDQVDELRRVDEQGHVLHVERHDDGRIVVKRYQSGAQDQAETKTYDNMEALAAGDPEAHRLLESARSKGGAPDKYTDFLRKLPRDKEAWRRYQDSLREHMDALRKHLDAMHEEIEKNWPEHEQRWREWGQRFFQGPLKKWKEGFDTFNLPMPPPSGEPFEAPAPPPPGGPVQVPVPPPAAAPPRVPIPPPTTRFEVDPKGQVKVYLREHDRELTMTFESRDQFAKEAPELYQQFQELERQVR